MSGLRANGDARAQEGHRTAHSLCTVTLEARGCSSPAPHLHSAVCTASTAANFPGAAICECGTQDSMRTSVGLPVCSTRSGRCPRRVLGRRRALVWVGRARLPPLVPPSSHATRALVTAAAGAQSLRQQLGQAMQGRAMASDSRRRAAPHRRPHGLPSSMTASPPRRRATSCRRWPTTAIQTQGAARGRAPTPRQLVWRLPLLRLVLALRVGPRRRSRHRSRRPHVGRSGTAARGLTPTFFVLLSGAPTPRGAARPRVLPTLFLPC